MPKNFYGCFRHETCGSKDSSKIAKFLAKTTSLRRCWRRWTRIQICSKMAYLVTNHGCMATTLKPKTNHTNRSVQKSQDRKKHAKFGQMWKFCSLFSSITMAPCIMNSCASWVHKVVRLIRNNTLKLCADYAKQFVRNAQNCGKTNLGFCTMIIHQLTHRCLYMSFWPKTKP